MTTKVNILPPYECASLAIQNEARERVRDAALRHAAQSGHTLPPSLPPRLLPPGDTTTGTTTAAGADPAKLIEALNEKRKRYEAQQLAHMQATTTPETFSDTLEKLQRAEQLKRKYDQATR